MQIFVLIKQVPGMSREEGGLEWTTSLMDEAAFLRALSLKRSVGARVTVLSLGPPRVKEVLRRACARGADRMIHILEDPSDPFDAARTAEAIATVLRKEEVDLVLGGAFSPDSGSGMVLPLVAGRLGIPCLSFVREMIPDSETNQYLFRREVEDAVEIYRASLPLVVSTLGAPGFSEQNGNRACSAEEPLEIPLESLGLEKKAPVARTFEKRKARPPVAWIQGNGPEEQAQELYRRLKEEAWVF